MSNDTTQILDIGSTIRKHHNTIKNIFINGGVADILIISSDDAKNIEAVLSTNGKILPSNKPSVVVNETNSKVTIDVKWSGINYPVFLYLQITIPNDLYNSITATSICDDITIGPNVKTKRLTVKTIKGNILVETLSYKIVQASSRFGNISIDFSTKKTELLNLETISNGLKVIRSKKRFINRK